MNEDDPIVFVVDDDRSIRESLRNLIRSVGLNVQTFASAQEFLTSQRPEAPSGRRHHSDSKHRKRESLEDH